MFMIRLIATGAIVTTTIFSAQATQQRENPTPPPPTMPPPAIPSLSTSHSAQGHSRPLPSLPKTSPGLELLKRISNQVVMDYKGNTISNLLKMLETQIFLDEKKPDGYGAMPFYTPEQKKDIIEAITKDLDKTEMSIQEMISELEEEEKKEGPIAIDRLYKLFANNVLGKFNLIWKNLNNYMLNMEKQVIRTKTLKERQCLSTIDKIQLGVQKTGVGIKKFVGMEKYSSSENKKSQE